MDTGKATEYLKALGVSAEDIAALGNEETAKDFDVKAAAAKVTKAQQDQLREALKNDPDLNDAIAKKFEGKFHGTLESAAKAVGLTKEEIYDDGGEKLKSSKEILKLVADKNSAGKSEDLKTLQEQLRDATAENKRLLDEEIPTIRKEEQSKAAKVVMNTRMKEQFLNFPKDDLVSKQHNDGIFNALMAGLEQKYDVRLGDNGEPELFIKGKDLRANTQDGTKQLALSDAIRGQLDEYGFVVKNAGGQQGAPPTPPARGGEAEPGAAAGNKATASSGRERALQMEKDIAAYGQ